MRLVLRIAFKSLMWLIIIGGGIGYLIQLRTGQPFFANIKQHLLQQTKTLTPPSLSVPALPDLPRLAPAPTPATTYKWVDNKGVVHYSDQPPSSQQAVQVVPMPTKAQP